MHIARSYFTAPIGVSAMAGGNAGFVVRDATLRERALLGPAQAHNLEGVDFDGK